MTKRNINTREMAVIVLLTSPILTNFLFTAIAFRVSPKTNPANEMPTNIINIVSGDFILIYW